MTASILKQNPNTKRFKRTLIYYDLIIILCVIDIINKHSFEPFCVWICGRKATLKRNKHKQNSSREMYSPIRRHIKKMKNTSTFDTWSLSGVRRGIENDKRTRKKRRR